MKLVASIIATLAAFALTGDAKISCKNESGKAVDWFIMLKHNNSFDYSYLDEKKQSFVASKNDLEQAEGALYETLTQVAKDADGNMKYYSFDEFMEEYENTAVSRRLLTATKKSDYGYVFYNDEKPDGSKSTTYAHAKGIIGFDGTQGFWLIHSMPKWPEIPTKKYKGLPDKRYGQSFMCLTLDLKNIEKVAEGMIINHPWIYASNLPSSLEKKMPNFAGLIDGDKVKDPTQKSFDLKTVGGHPFTQFAKNKQGLFDLYEDVVAPGINADMATETWQNGGHLSGNFCKPKYKYQVQNINTVSVNGVEWGTHQDHSKWGISTSKGSKWVCVGDINRQTSQAKRGGGTVCTKYSSKLYAAFNDVAEEIDACK